MHIREVAEATGLKVPASKYRENMSNHFMYGNNERTAEHMQEYGDKAQNLKITLPRVSEISYDSSYTGES